MTENEKELINLIRNHNNPIEALVKATAIITGFLCNKKVIIK